MRRYIVKRLILMVISLLLIMTVSYFAVSFAMLKKYTDLPIADYVRTTWITYKIYLRRILFEWDFGVIEQNDTPAWDTFLMFVGISLKINMVAFAFYVPLGIIGGVLAGIYKGSWFDRIFSNVFLVFNSIPIFILMFLFIFYLGYHLKIGHYQYVESYGARNYILPVLALSLAPINRLARVIRSEIIEQSQSEYILLARIKGLTHRQAMMRHGIRHSLTAVIHVLPDVFLFALMGSVFVELIYHIPGVARLLIRSLVRVSPVGGLYVYIDINLVMVILLFYSVLSIGMNLIADILIVWIDPRIQFD